MLKLHITMIATILLVGIISYYETCGAALVADIQGVPYHVKRSFCNTYGGCSSSKRSFQQQQQQQQQSQQQQNANVNYANVVSTTDNNKESVGGPEMTKKDSSASLVAEILEDLIEYLQTDEKYRQGKYVVMVPKQVDAHNPLSNAANQRESNNPGEMQELQVSRLYVKRDD